MIYISLSFPLKHFLTMKHFLSKTWAFSVVVVDGESQFLFRSVAHFPTNRNGDLFHLVPVLEEEVFDIGIQYCHIFLGRRSI